MPSNIDNQLVQPENLNDEALLAANVLLFDAMVRHQVFLMRLNGSLRNETEKLLNATEEDIANLILVRLHGVEGATPRNLAIVALLISDIRKLRHAAWTEVRTLWRSTLGELTESEVRFLATALETSLPVEYDAVPPVDKVSTAAKALPFEGQTLSQWSNRIEEEDMRRIAQQIRIGLVQGEPARVIAARVIGTARMRGRNGVTQITRRRADAIVRTAIIHFSNVARTAFLAANEEMFSEEMYVATLDSRTTPICVVGDTPVQPLGDVSVIYRREYVGKMATIRTARGKKLVITPNHPVLTLRGWVAAGEISPGDKVIDAVLFDGVSVESDESVAVPPNIAALFDAAFEPTVSEIRTESSSTEQFHGDGTAGDEEVYIAHPNGSLGSRINTGIPEFLRKHLFRGREAGRLFPSADHLQDMFVRRRPLSETSEREGVSLGNTVEPRLALAHLFNDLAGSVSVVEHGDGLVLISNTSVPSLAGSPESPASEERGNGGGGEPDCPTDTGRALAIFVASDDVVAVTVDRAHGVPVYNIETSQGLYTAGGLVVKNCRSLDGNTYPLGEGPMPPIHWNCRSLRVPRITPDAVGSRPAKAVTEAMLVREYARKNGLKRAKHQKDIPVGHRVDYERFARRRTRELTAIVPAKQTYGEWLARQSAEFQNDTLGISKARLFRKGGLTLDKFVNRRGDELTLAQLAQREAVAFRAAGLDPGDYR